jgi:hypothetical protein
VTVEDPQYYTKPWSARFVYDHHPKSAWITGIFQR